MQAGRLLITGESIDLVARQLGISTASAKRDKSIIEVGGLDDEPAIESRDREPSGRRYSRMHVRKIATDLGLSH
jgi:hypothetical protein